MSPILAAPDKACFFIPRPIASFYILARSPRDGRRRVSSVWADRHHKRMGLMHRRENSLAGSVVTPRSFWSQQSLCIVEEDLSTVLDDQHAIRSPAQFTAPSLPNLQRESFDPPRRIEDLHRVLVRESQPLAIRAKDTLRGPTVIVKRSDVPLDLDLEDGPAGRDLPDRDLLFRRLDGQEPRRPANRSWSFGMPSGMRLTGRPVDCFGYVAGSRSDSLPRCEFDHSCP